MGTAGPVTLRDPPTDLDHLERTSRGRLDPK